MLTLLKGIGFVIGAAVVAAPVAFVATLLLFPFWAWLENRFGIESIGHSGPDDWCFIATYAAIVAGALLLLLRVYLSRRRTAQPN